MIYITRKEHFNAAHKLHRADWTEEKNAEVFGKCANPNWHGHNYEVFVTVKGEPAAETGFVIDLKFLSKLIKERVIDKLDHKNINMDVDFMYFHLCHYFQMIRYFHWYHWNHWNHLFHLCRISIFELYNCHIDLVHNCHIDQAHK
jgi:6-pyruvoyl tetrahydropterin synthase/QueD family protein